MFRVYYPLISTEAHRDFETREAANAFAAQQRDRVSPYLMRDSWRLVQVIELEGETRE